MRATDALWLMHAGHSGAVIVEINRLRTSLASVLRAPKHWTGGLRRTAQARALQIRRSALEALSEK